MSGSTYLNEIRNEVKFEIMNDIMIKDDVEIGNLIYEIRGLQVMLDSDLARLYEVETKQLNRQVKRNIERFDEDFMFQLTNSEYQNLRCQTGTSSSNNYGGRRTLPYVFTEMGVTTLASVLHSTVAVNMSKKIIRAFVMMRHYISSSLVEQKYINNLVLEDHSKIKALETSFQKLEEKRKINEIYFNGQIYDAYSKIQDIFNDSKKQIIIIDAYADYTLLDIIKRLKIEVIIITKPDNLLTKQDITKYNKQYHNLRVIFNNDFHDRYFILDDSKVYHCGTSINRIGYKTFSINLINDEDVCQTLICKVNKIM